MELCQSHLFSHPNPLERVILIKYQIPYLTHLGCLLRTGSKSRVACETLVKSNCVTIAGEITTDLSLITKRSFVRQSVRLDTLMTMIFFMLIKFL